MNNDAITSVIAFLLFLALSWALCVGLFALICLCFSWEFSLATATGVWIVLLIAKWVFRGYGND